MLSIVDTGYRPLAAHLTSDAIGNCHGLAAVLAELLDDVDSVRESGDAQTTHCEPGQEGSQGDG